MSLKSLLINPWVYDFAAMNLWSRPLGLLKVAEYMSRFDLAIGFIDCMDVAGRGGVRQYGIGRYPRSLVKKPRVLEPVPRHYARYGMDLDTFQELLKKNLPCDFVLMSSVMSYWYPGVQKAVEIIREVSPHTPVILGGIYATLCHDHALQHSGADIVYRGNIGPEILSLLRDLGLNLTEKNPPRPYYRLGLYQNPSFAPIVTSYGCPFRCTYCASPLLFEGFIKRHPREILKEIEDLSTLGIRDLALYDDALLVHADSHLKVILREIITGGMRLRFHCPNGLHARFLDDEVAYLMKESGFTTLRLGFETVDDSRQSATGGKVTANMLQRAVKNLKKHGYTKKQIGVYLMYGLPGQEFREVREGIAYLKGLNVRIHLTEFSPIPGTPCWKELQKEGIVVHSTDPLITNNSVFSFLCSGYDRQDLEEMKRDVTDYNRTSS